MEKGGWSCGRASGRQFLLALSGSTSLDASMTRFRYFLAIFVPANWYAAPFLSYPLPIFSYWLLWIALGCSIPLFFFLLGALFRRDAKAVAIFSVAWVLTVLPLFDLEPVERFRGWLHAQGFRIHASPVEDYLSTCKITHFVEKGIKQAVGQCEYTSLAYDSFAYVIFYDTTGELALPISRRTREWNDAMWHYSPKKVLLEGEPRAEHLFENFYRVGISIDEFEG